MKCCLNWWDLTWFVFGSVIGTGIFVLTGQEAHDHAGPAIILSYMVSGISAMLSVFCYTEFADEIPIAGGSFAYLRVELGDLAAFIAAGNILLESIVGSAAVARGWTSYCTTPLDRHSDSLRIHTDLTHGFNLLDPIVAGVLLTASAIAITSAKKTSILNWIASAVNTVVISHPKTGTPIYATLLITLPSAAVALFSSLDMSVSTLFIFMMMVVALLVRRYYMRGVTPRANLVKLIPLLLLIIASSVGTSAYWGLRPGGWIGYAVTIPIWFVATLGMAVMLPQERTPEVWGVPLVPWLPSLSIAINLFLMGSLSGKTFVRFGVCTVMMLLYYVLFGVHATYDMAQQIQTESANTEEEEEAKYTTSG